MIYKLIIRPVLFLFPAESVHHFIMKVLRFAGSVPVLLNLMRNFYIIRDKRLEHTVAGIKFPNRVGLAAGFDKDAIAFEELGSLGFGFIEIGTVTPVAQEGNPKPRLFRLPSDKALINRMGFNNSGVKAAAGRLKKRSGKVIIGGNIGKNKITSNEDAVNDYLVCFRELFPVVDYFVINISSPNTPGLRELQEKAPLMHLLQTIQKENAGNEKSKPVFLKIAPDLTLTQVDDIIEIAIACKLSGLIIANTTISREELKTSVEELQEIGAGGLSGLPVLERSTDLVRYVSTKAGKQFAIIASGGINSAQDAKAKIDAGADLVQLYTGFIYEGPNLIKKINRALLNN